MCAGPGGGRPPRSVARRAISSPRSGWSRIAGGPAARCGAATSSWSSPEAATRSSSATFVEGDGSSSARDRRMPYVELHCHSSFSFLDGASHPVELAAAAAEQGHEAIAITDHDGLYGAMELAQATAPLR